MEYCLNVVHYFIYKADFKLHILSNKFNPFLLLGKIPIIKRKFEEQGTTQLDVVNTLWTDRRFGIGIMVSGAGIMVTLGFLLWGLVTITASLLNIHFYVKFIHVVIFGIISYLICHFAVFQKDKYLKYFKKFDRWSRKEKTVNGILSFCFITGSIVIWLYSFRF